MGTRVSCLGTTRTDLYFALDDGEYLETERLPDRKILKDGREIALVDWKGKSKDYWMINERAYKGYLECSSKLKLPVYVAIWAFQNNRGKFIKLPAGKVSKKTEWDRNAVVIFDSKSMKAWKDLLTELNAL